VEAEGSLFHLNFSQFLLQIPHLFIEFYGHYLKMLSLKSCYRQTISAKTGPTSGLFELARFAIFSLAQMEDFGPLSSSLSSP